MAKKKPKKISEADIQGLGTVVLGTKVNHAKFGNGVVEDIASWDNGFLTLGVNFNSRGLVWLVPEYANLKLGEPRK